jgi:hypothetical protein
MHITTGLIEKCPAIYHCKFQCANQAFDLWPSSKGTETFPTSTNRRSSSNATTRFAFSIERTHRHTDRPKDSTTSLHQVTTRILNQILASVSRRCSSSLLAQGWRWCCVWITVGIHGEPAICGQQANSQDARDGNQQQRREGASTVGFTV